MEVFLPLVVVLQELEVLLVLGVVLGQLVVLLGEPLVLIPGLLEVNHVSSPVSDVKENVVDDVPRLSRSGLSVNLPEPFLNLVVNMVEPRVEPESLMGPVEESGVVGHCFIVLPLSEVVDVSPQPSNSLLGPVHRPEMTDSAVHVVPPEVVVIVLDIVLLQNFEVVLVPDVELDLLSSLELLEQVSPLLVGISENPPSPFHSIEHGSDGVTDPKIPWVELLEVSLVVECPCSLKDLSSVDSDAMIEAHLQPQSPESLSVPAEMWEILHHPLEPA